MPFAFPKDVSNYQLIVSDFDGTLGNQDKVVSQKVILSVKKWIKSGKKFSLATGRQHLMITDVIEKLELVDPIVTRGGAEIVEPKTGKVIYSNYINKKTLEDFLEFFDGHGLELAIEHNDSIYSDYYYRADYVPIIKFKKLQEFDLSEVPKLLVFAIDGDIEKKVNFVEKILRNRFPQLFIVSRNTNRGIAWDITSEKATKHLTVLELTKILNINKTNIVGVGDGYNDFPLLEVAGLKVAMSNANEELKEIADVIVPSIEEDGVAYLIDRLLNNSEF